MPKNHSRFLQKHLWSAKRIYEFICRYRRYSVNTLVCDVPRVSHVSFKLSVQLEMSFKLYRKQPIFDLQKWFCLIRHIWICHIKGVEDATDFTHQSAFTGCKSIAHLSLQVICQIQQSICIVGNVGTRFWQERRMLGAKKTWYIWCCCISFNTVFKLSTVNLSVTVL